MTKYKKSILSVAAAMAISATALTADYVPLSTTANDNEWVLFGVNGFVTDGVVATTAGVFSIASNAANAVIDPTVDAIAVSGFTVGGKDFASIKAISLTAPLEVRVDLTTNAPTWNEEEPIRTIYVDTNSDGSPNFAFEYKASLEGRTLEYTIDSGTAYTLTIDYVNTYDNPVVGVVISDSPGNSGTVLNELLDTNSKSAVDYDFAGNPPSIANYDHATNRDTITTGAGTGNLKMYTYDAVNGLWQIFDAANTIGTNDFDTLTKGKGYWGKLDTNIALAAADEEAGMVLASGDINSTQYITAGLADGWNLLSFDDINSKIRNSSTGMILSLVAVAGGEQFIISDSSRNHSITITIGTGVTPQEVAKDVNSQISQAKALGTLPDTLNINAFRVSATQIVLLSNQKFSVRDTADAVIGSAATLAIFDAASRSLWDEATNAFVDYNAGDVLLTDVTSVYGHNAMVVEPLVNGAGTGLAADLALNVTAKVALVSDGDETPKVPVFVAADTVTLATAQLNGTGTGGIISAFEIDLDHDGTTDHVLMAATEPFSIRDNTFSRVFTYTDSAVDGTIKITNSGTAIADQTITAAARTTATQVSGDINTVGVLSAGTPTADTTKIVFVNDYDNSSDFKILETTGDHLTVSSTSDDMAKGAIKGVYSLDYLAKKDVNNIITLDIDQIPDGLDDTIGFSFATVFGTTSIAEDTGTNLGIQALYTLDDDPTTGACAYFSDVAGLMTTHFTNNAYDATATVTCVNFAGLDAANIVITGPDVTASAYLNTENVDEAAGAAGVLPGDESAALGTAGYIDDVGHLTTLVADITSNLRYNVEYTPDYVMDGPLFVMKEAGYKLNAVVTGNMDLSDGTITWDSIDLTRAPSEWLDSQDYNLFDTNAKAGYWAYLETDATPNPITIGTAVLSKNYTHHFDTTATAEQTFNEYSGTLDVQITGIDYTIDNAASSRVVASINGKKIELSRNGLTTSYTGKVSLFESGGISLNTATEIIVSISDGLGNNFTDTLPLSTFDNVKPVAPTVVRNGLDINVTSGDAGLAGIYVFENVIPENNTEALKLAYATTNGVITNICADMTAVTPATGGGSAPVSIKVIAVDGNGVLDAGNASDATSIIYMPILKARAYVEDIHNGGVPVATGGGVDYNSSCVSQGALTVNTGVTISSLNDGETVRLAYGSLGEELVTSVPTSVYVSDGGSPAIISKLTYPDNYIGDGVYIEIGGQMYEFTLIAEPAAGVAGADSANPLNISADALTGVSF